MKNVFAFILIVVALAFGQKPQIEWSLGESADWIIPFEKTVEWRVQLKLLKNYNDLNTIKVGPTENLQSPQIRSLPALNFSTAFYLYDGIFQIDGGRLLSVNESWSQNENQNHYKTNKYLNLNKIAASYLLNPFYQTHMGIKLAYYEFSIGEEWDYLILESILTNDTLHNEIIQKQKGNWSSDKQTFSMELFFKWQNWSFSFSPMIKESIKYPLNTQDHSIDENENFKGKLNLPAKFNLKYENLWVQFNSEYYYGDLAYDFSDAKTKWSALKIIPHLNLTGQLKWFGFWLKLGGMWIEPIKTPGGTELFFPHLPITSQVLDFLPYLALGYYNRTLIKGGEFLIGLETLPWLNLKLEVSHGW